MRFFGQSTLGRPGLETLSKPSNVVFFGSPKKSPSRKTNQTQKGTTLEGLGKPHLNVARGHGG